MEWEVREVGARGALADGPARARPGATGEPWLCFESATQRRRLDRYPPWWHALSADELTALCRAASPAPPPRVIEAWRPPRRSSAPDKGR